MKLQKFRDGLGRVILGIGYVGLTSLFVMVFVVAIDVVLRKASGSSLRISGSNELTAFLMVIVCSLFIPALQYKKGHIWVPLFVDRFPYRFRCFWLFGIMLIETGIIAMLSIGAYKLLLDRLSTGRATDVLRLPYWICGAVILLAFIEYFIISLVDTIQLCMMGVKNDQPKPEEKGWTDEEVKGI